MGAFQRAKRVTCPESLALLAGPNKILVIESEDPKGYNHKLFSQVKVVDNALLYGTMNSLVFFVQFVALQKPFSWS
ncbi:hypothetical protein INT44_005879 [Umbelopsis vinacea]|uniref:Uncharacterized protein n=1 Tax=Umbelopsis vinacea TaxID=44442 RepID=A0A8H7PZ35_9FUNG|nr:hypothetical protein INT44_005879 [Umbelopsis vinacea]